MKKIIVNDVIGICKGILLCGDLNTACESFSINTKEIKKDDVFIGIKGAKFNGNSFYLEAFSSGASVCILDRDYESKIELNKISNDKTIILVDDTIDALQELARYKRSLYDIPVIAITGSVGKTSTKDIIASVLNEKYHVLKTEGNFNNNIGLPLTILRLNNHNTMVLEMGMNNLGEISLLSDIAKPTLAIITNIGTAHIGNLGSQENILKAKLEIIDGLEDNGILIINNDDEFLHNINTELNVVTCGINKSSQIMAKDISYNDNGSNFTISYNQNDYPFEINIATKVFVYNSLIAFAVGVELGISIDSIKQGLLNAKLTKNRFELIKGTKNITIINDSYNASYDSMKNSLTYLNDIKEGRKIAILGDMLELGAYSEEIHEKLGKDISELSIDYLITIGNDSKYISDETKARGMINVNHFSTKEDSYAFLKELIKENDVILVKASNSLKFVEVVEYLKNL